MHNTFKDAVKHRRSYYSICGKSPVSDEEINEMLEFTLLNVPSAFNSQSTRIILLLGGSHTRLWDITLNILRAIVPTDNFHLTEEKIGSFAAGYGTILFFEDQATVTSLQNNFALYADKFPTWAEHTSGMHQFAVWTMLEDMGFGASLQHYNPIIDDNVHTEWNISKDWKLIAQMPFGSPTHEPGEKSSLPVSDRLRVFR